MPRKYSQDSLRNQAGFTVRARPADRKVIAAHAKRWGCGLGEATLRLAMAGAHHQGSDPHQERIQAMEQWLSDCQDYFDALAAAITKWKLSQDDAHRLMVDAMALLPGEVCSDHQRVAHATRVAAQERIGSFAGDRQDRPQGLAVMQHWKHRGIVTDVRTAMETPPRQVLAPMAPEASNRTPKSGLVSPIEWGGVWAEYSE